MDDIISIKENDGMLTKCLKRECGIILDTLDRDTYKYYDALQCFSNAIKITEIIDKMDAESEEEIEDVLYTVNAIWRKGVLSPLTLKDDEFFGYAEDNKRRNMRYDNIYIDIDNGKIYNNNAYSLIVRTAYGAKMKVYWRNEVYLRKGNYFTGEYIKRCAIPENVVDKHCYSIQSVVNINVNMVANPKDEHKILYVADVNNKNLKVLNEFYNVETGIDKSLAGCRVKYFDKVKDYELSS